jgi:hypothetical protein
MPVSGFIVHHSVALDGLDSMAATIDLTSYVFGMSVGIFGVDQTET